MRPETGPTPQDYWNLRIFCTVAEEQSVSRAARRLVMSQPGVSMAIHRLEQHYRTQLVVRSGNHVMLTETGAAFYQHALTTLRSAADFEARLESLEQKSTQALAVATRPALSVHYLPPVLAQFWRRHPDVEVRVVVLHARLTVLREVLDDGVAFALLPRGGGVVAGPELVIEPFYREPLVLIAAPDHRLAREPEPSLAEIARERFIVNSRDYSQVAHLDERFRAEGCGPLRVAMEVSGDGAKELVRAGVGLALVLRCTVEQELARGELGAVVIPGSEPAMDLVLAYHRTGGLTPLASELAALVRAHVLPPGQRNEGSGAARTA
jgi:DNA-binding transcriptional LysR family regulator